MSPSANLQQGFPSPSKADAMFIGAERQDRGQAIGSITKNSPMDDALTELDTANAELSSALDRLMAALDPVMYDRSADVRNEAAVPVPAASRIVSFIRDQAGCVHQARNRVMRMLELIEI